MDATPLAADSEKLVRFLMNSISNTQIRMISSDFAFVPNYNTHNLFKKAACNDEGLFSRDPPYKRLIQEMFFFNYFLVLT